MSEKPTYVISPENLKLYQDKIVQTLEYELYKVEIDQTQATEELIEIRKEGEFEKLEAKLKKLKADFEALKDEKPGKDEKKDHKLKLVRMEQELRGTQFLRDKLFDGNDKLNKEIVEAAKKLAAIKVEIDFTKNFDRSKLTQLPYLEIEGTRYATTPDNNILLDEAGAKILYFGREDVAKNSA